MTDAANKAARLGSTEYEEMARAAAVDLYPDADLAAMALCFNLVRVANRVTKDLEVSVYRPLGISFAGYRVLFSIKTVGEVNPNDLARLSGVSTASMSSLLNTLERNGLITRGPDPEDKRKAIVRLSHEGERIVASLGHLNNLREQEWAAGLTATEASILAELLRKLLLHHPPELHNDVLESPPTE